MKLVAHTVVLALLCTIFGCGAPSDGPSTHNAISKDATTEEIKIGGIYAYKNDEREGKYGLRKVVAVDNLPTVDDLIVHVRIYNEEFDDLPTNLSSDDLTVHNDVVAGTLEGFLSDRLDLVTVEGVSESELEGYRLWVEAMHGDTEVEKLRRQNRWLKVALFTVIVAGLVSTSFLAVRARRMEVHLRAQEASARAAAEQAVLIAEAARQEAESRNAEEPGS